MAHEKVYGVCENKCFVETITKSEYELNKTYTTEEQIVGTWIDGTPIYRRVISLHLKDTITAPANKISVTPIDITPIENVNRVIDFKRINMPYTITSSGINYYNTRGDQPLTFLDYAIGLAEHIISQIRVIAFNATSSIWGFPPDGHDYEFVIDYTKVNEENE